VFSQKENWKTNVESKIKQFISWPNTVIIVMIICSITTVAICRITVLALIEYRQNLCIYYTIDWMMRRPWYASTRPSNWNGIYCMATPLATEYQGARAPREHGKLGRLEAEWRTKGDAWPTRPNNQPSERLRRARGNKTATKGSCGEQATRLASSKLFTLR